MDLIEKKIYDQKQSRELGKIFKALSDETRLNIMHYLLDEGRHCVMEIAEALGISQTASSRNLAYLRDTGFLHDERDGLCTYYEIIKEHTELIEFLVKHFNERN